VARARADGGTNAASRMVRMAVVESVRSRLSPPQALVTLR